MNQIAEGILIGVVFSAWSQVITSILMVGQAKTGAYTPGRAIATLILALVVSWAVWKVLA